MSRGEEGITLAEILVASAVALVVVIGIGTMDVGRLRMENELRSTIGVTTDEEQVALTALSLAKALERADRINVLNTGIAGNAPFVAADEGDLQIRTFDPDTDCPVIGAGCPIVCTGCTGALAPPCCFDIPGNSRWDEYKRNAATNQIRLYYDAAAGCAQRVLAGEAARMTVTFKDEAPPPTGGEPGVGSAGNEDNNTIEYKIRWDNGLAGSDQRTRDFRGQVTSRAIPYSNVQATVGNSGWGQATGAADPSPPPAACP